MEEHSNNAGEQVCAGEPARSLPGYLSELGGSVSGIDAAAFTLLQPVSPPIPVLLSVPHAGREYPPSLLARMRHPAQTAKVLEDRLVDRLGEAIARATGAGLIVAEAPRAMVDLNRAPDDVDWSMITGADGGRAANSAANRRARVGLGVVPRRIARLGEIWNRPLDAAELRERVDAIHAPYHAAVSRTLTDLRDQWGAALLIDLHSMPPLPTEGEANAGAQIVLGDRFGSACRKDLSAFALSHLGRARKVAHNLPYAGGYMLDCHSAPRRGIHALQVEVCRSAYLDSDLWNLGVRFNALARELASFVKAIAVEVTWAGRAHLPIAAE